MKLQVDQLGNVLVQLRDGTPTVQKHAQAIIDLNMQGSWTGGIELLGELLDFSLEQALSPFRPKMPALGEERNPQDLRVTYDLEANAAYIYLPLGRRYQRMRDNERLTALKYSHSITPNVTIVLDQAGGLLSVVVPTADAVKSVQEFLYLFDIPSDGTNR